MHAADMNKIWLQLFLCSTKGVGQTAPDMVESKITDDGVVVPLGKPKQEPSKRVCTFPCCIYMVIIYFQMQIPYGKHRNCENTALWLQGDLLYNEYIVYNVDQIRMRYVLIVNFNFKRR